MTKEKNTTKERVECITHTRLIKEFGWSDALAKKYLPEPKLVDNPHYKCVAPMKLYELEVVQRVSSTEPVKTLLAELAEKRVKRTESSKKAIATKKANLAKEVDEKIKLIKVKLINDDDLRGRTISAKNEWNSWNDYRGDFIPVRQKDVDEFTMRRWVVNFIRHNLTEYDEDLFDIKGKTGIHEEYYRYRDAVLDKIAEVYPKYADECFRQQW